MTAPIRLALVGMGKIARDQHLPAVWEHPGFAPVACVDPRGAATDDLPVFADIAALAASGIAVDAVAICTPPQVRRAAAEVAIARGWHVLLEKPPAATLSEVAALCDAASVAGVGLFAAWHSRYAAAVEPARAWLAGRTVRRVQIIWREDVRIWHPGQEWIWRPGGFGVFDPGINALSIATRILPFAFFAESAVFDMPANRAAPIAAHVVCRGAAGAPVELDLDFRQEGPQTWDIAVETDAGTLVLSNGGGTLAIDGVAATPAADRDGEYPRLYRRFGEVVAGRLVDVDVAPLRLVADAFLLATVVRVGDFVDRGSDLPHPAPTETPASCS